MPSNSGMAVSCVRERWRTEERTYSTTSREIRSSAFLANSDLLSTGDSSRGDNNFGCGISDGGCELSNY